MQLINSDDEFNLQKKSVFLFVSAYQIVLDCHILFCIIVFGYCKQCESPAYFCCKFK
eukprot:UN11614